LLIAIVGRLSTVYAISILNTVGLVGRGVANIYDIAVIVEFMDGWS
jgi:hypothetical protein